MSFSFFCGFYTIWCSFRLGVLGLQWFFCMGNSQHRLHSYSYEPSSWRISRNACDTPGRHCVCQSTFCAGWWVHHINTHVKISSWPQGTYSLWCGLSHMVRRRTLAVKGASVCRDTHHAQQRLQPTLWLFLRDSTCSLQGSYCQKMRQCLPACVVHGRLS